MKYTSLLVLAAIGSFVGGAAAYRIVSQQGLLPFEPHIADDHEGEELHSEDAHEEQHEQHEEHIELSRQAIANLHLEIAAVERSNYEQVLRIPGEVVEQPGHSAHVLAAPVNGIVSKALALPGMAVRPGEPLFELQVVDEQVFEAQLELLESVTRLEIIESELDRLAPLATSGMVAGRQKLDLEYEKKQRQTTRELRIQELLARGLEPSHVTRLLETRQLLRSIVVRAPNEASHTDAHGLAAEGASIDSKPRPLRNPVEPVVAVERGGGPWSFTVEELLISPGQTVNRGQGLCDLAHHAELYVQGHVFESEVDDVLRTAENDWPLAVEFGVADQEYRRNGLRIRYIANHVDPETQTFLFYAPLRNEVLNETADSGTRRFRTWRFKVGQRVEILAPIKQYQDCLKLPANAVVEDGLNALVFRQCEDCDDHEEHDAHAEELEDHDMHDEDAADAARAREDGEAEADREFAIELEPVQVAVKFRDRDFVVLHDDGQIETGDVIAMNGAYQLLLASRAQSEQGGGHHHHDH